MRIRIGYIQLKDRSDDAILQSDHLMAMGAQVVRVEDGIDGEGLFKPRLNAICDFIGEGDELIAPDLRHFGETADAAADVVRRVRERGAHIRILDPDMSTVADNGRAIGRELERMRQRPCGYVPPKAARPAGKLDVRAIMALRSHGFGPSQIAKKLGVSRMTVWRKLASQVEVN